jgi:hypothetical protein
MLAGSQDNIKGKRPMHIKTYTTVAVSCLTLLLASGALAAPQQGPSAPPSMSAATAPSEAPLVDDAGQAIDENGDAVAFEDLPAISGDSMDAAPLVDENGQAVDADGNAIAEEDLPPPRTVMEWIERQDFGQLFNFGA